jgi:predicted MFS family arabinose efflux permease
VGALANSGNGSRIVPRHLLLPVGLVAFCFALGILTRGINDSFSVFVPSVQQSFDAERAAVTSIYGMTMLGLGFAGPLMGLALDRFGPRMLALGGLLCAAAGVLAASQAQALWHLHLALGIGMGAGSAALGGVFQAAVLGRWFAARLGTAIAIAWSASGVGVMLVAPLAEHLIAVRDWRFAWLVLGAAILGMVPVVLLMPWRRIAAGSEAFARLRRQHEEARTSFGLTLHEAMRGWPFWSMTLSFAATSIAIYCLMPQLVAYLVFRGFSPASAARVVAVTGVLMPIGMIGFNWLADRGGRAFAAAAAYLCTGLGVVALWLVDTPDALLPLAAFIILFGSTMGSRGPMISTLATLRYRGAHVGRIYGLITAGSGVGGALGAWLGGAVHDATGGYGAVMLLSLAALACGAAFLVGEARSHGGR